MCQPQPAVALPRCLQRGVHTTYSHANNSLCVCVLAPTLICRRFWLWLCGGLTVKDALVIAVWAAYNAVWYSTILSQALDKAKARAHGAGHGAGHGSSGYGGVGLTPRNIASTFASLAAPNLIPLLFPVSRCVVYWVCVWGWN